MPADANYPAMKLLQLAVGELQAGRIAEAEAGFQKVLAHEPANGLALHQVGLIAYKRGDGAAARGLLARAVAAEPTNLAVLTSYGVMLHEMSQPREALEAFLRALAVDSTQAEVWNAAGICFQEIAQPVKAMEFYLRALTLQPEYPEALNNMGVVLTQEGDNDAAIEHFRLALALQPGYPDCYSNLGVALRNRFEYAAAIAAFREGFRLRPDRADMAGALGEALSLIYDDEAEAMLRLGVELQPGDPEKHWNLALELLKRGNYAEGWREYEWRWKRTRDQTPLPAFAQPYWRNEAGQDIAGKTILLHAEQGFGDTLQFLRYVPMVLAEGARVVVEVQPELKRLVEVWAREMDGVMVIAAGEMRPAFDFHTPLMSLPPAFGTTLETVPAPVRLLPAVTEARRGGETLRVGLAWAGNRAHARDRERSVPWEALLPLFDVPGCAWVNLQVGGTGAEQMDMERPVLHDFLDVAEVIETLDVVLCVDSAVAHLAGSLGARTWILLPYVADWRWMRPEQTVSPWYPEAQLFRQTRMPAGESQGELWKPVMEEVVRELMRCREGLGRAVGRGQGSGSVVNCEPSSCELTSKKEGSAREALP
jgi:Tfp pilus assembly protein PilF